MPDEIDLLRTFRSDTPGPGEAAWEKARAAIAKPNLRVHDLRHVGAVLAAQSGATTAELMHRLGHTTPQMALQYQHVAEGRDADIAERLSKLAAGQGK